MEFVKCYIKLMKLQKHTCYKYRIVNIPQGITPTTRLESGKYNYGVVQSSVVSLSQSHVLQKHSFLMKWRDTDFSELCREADGQYYLWGFQFYVIIWRKQSSSIPRYKATSLRWQFCVRELEGWGFLHSTPGDRLVPQYMNILREGITYLCTLQNVDNILFPKE